MKQMGEEMGKAARGVGVEPQSGKLTHVDEERRTQRSRVEGKRGGEHTGRRGEVRGKGGGEER